MCAEYAVECRADGCGAAFDVKEDCSAVQSWQHEHMKKTGHREFWEHASHPTIVTAPPGSIVASRVAEYSRTAAETGPKQVRA